MKNTVKIIALLAAAIMLAVTFAACANSGDATSSTAVSEAVSNVTSEASSEETSEAEAVTVRAVSMTGPTSMGLVSLMKKNEEGTSLNKYTFDVVAAADAITPKLIKGEYDIASIPANLAAVLSGKTNGGIQVVAVNTLGVLYIVTKGTDITSLEDLRGKTMYATGKGSTPEYTLKYLLKQAGMDPEKDVTIEWKTEPAEVVSLLSANETGIAMLPQPYVTVAAGKVEGLKTAISLTDEWDSLENGSSLITSVIVVRKEFAEKNPEAVANFIREAGESVTYVKANYDEAAALVFKYVNIAEAVAKKALPYCNLTFITGEEMKTALGGYLGIMFAENPASVGGTLPGDELFYE